MRLQHASAEDLLLALLKGSAPVASSQPGSATQTQSLPAMQPSAKRAKAGAAKALPQSSAANGKKSAGPQQVSALPECFLPAQHLYSVPCKESRLGAHGG
jgi:hypothetical protein